MAPPVATSDLRGCGDVTPNDRTRLQDIPEGSHGASLKARSIDIAICGMACRLPGGLHTPQQFWDFLIAKGDARGRVPESRYNTDTWYCKSMKPASINTEYGYFLDKSINLAHLDTSFFSMKRAEVNRADPQQRQMLEVVREAMEDAGEANYRGKHIGVFLGNFGEDWQDMWGKDVQVYGLYCVGGYCDFMLPNRISYEMDLHGPSFLVRTACSSSMMALHEACNAITRGDCISAIVGGANLILAPGMSIAMSDQGVLSKDGSCKTFSSDANGYARGEAINCLFIKPLEDAVRDGNPVRAVIRSTAAGSDGFSPVGLFAPNAEAQADMMRRAYAAAGIRDLSKTAFVECHGTGTPIGDPIETKAVADVFGSEKGVYIGSVKPNVGHGEGASGLTSVIKAVLALENKTIPPNIKFTSPNPNIRWDANLRVPVEPTPFPDDCDERISVNSFGVGGSNAHVILDSASSFGITRTRTIVPESPQLLVFSANTPESLDQLTKTYKEYLEADPEIVADVAYNLSNRRDHLPHRAFAIATKGQPLNVSAPTKSGKAPNIVMVFTGQGAQWPQMGKELLQDSSYLVFKNSIRSLDNYLQSSSFKLDWTIEEELLKPSKTSRLNTAELSQPLCTAIQVALVDLLASIGVVPAAVVGHSSGEIAAAYASGALTAKEAILCAFHRGAITKTQTKAGAMAAIGLRWEAVERFLVPGVIVACENSPQSVTLSGDADKVKEVVSNIKDAEPDVLARLLQVDKAYHSRHMTEIGEDYHTLISKQVLGKEPEKLFFSSVTGQIYSPETPLGARYWQKNLESPVLFSTAVTSLLKHEVAKNAFFLEVGPHTGLQGPLRQVQTQNSNPAPYTAAMLRRADCIESFLTAVGKLYSANVPVNFKTLIPNGTTLPDLPRYPYNHSESFWFESRLSMEWRHRQHPYHDLLGVRILECTESEPVWRNVFHLENAPWIRDHKCRDDIIFPFVGYATIAGEAVRQISGIQEGYTLQHVVVNSALVLLEGKPAEIMTTFRRKRLTDNLDSDWWEFIVSSYNGYMWMKHCTGLVRALGESLGAAKKLDLPPRKVASRRCYDSMLKSGFNFGPAFQLLEEIRSGTTKQFATAKAVNKDWFHEGYHLHPTLIDASIQLLTLAATKGYASANRSKLCMPTNMEELSVYRCTSALDMNASAQFIVGGGMFGQADCISGGQIVCRIRGLKLTVADEGQKEENTDITARTEWGPHIDFVDANSLIKSSIDRSLTTPLLDELTQLFLVGSQRRLIGKKSRLPHLQKFSAWIDRQVESLSTADLRKLDDQAIESLIKSLVGRLAETEAVDASIAMYNTFSNIERIFSGEKDALELLREDDRLGKIYAFTDKCDRSSLLQRLAHSKPNLRILEIGAGSGATTRSILRDLEPADGNILFSEYVFTDISAAFHVSAKENFKEFPNIEYAVLDISKDPANQGFEGREFDLIVAVNVIHATRNIQESLKNVRKLLAPNGRFFLTELNATSKWANYVWGTLPGWWLGEADGRPDEPYAPPKRWEEEFRAAGFEGLDAVVLDSEEPHQLNAMYIGKPSAKKTPQKRVTLLTHETSSPGLILGELKKRGYIVDRRSPKDAPLPAGQDVIAVLDQDRPFFDKITAERWEEFKKLITSLDGSGIFWVTNPAQMASQDPRFASVIGIARTVRSELLIDFATCEVDNINSSLDLIADVFVKFQVREEDVTFKPELEFAISNRSVNVGRIFPFSLKEELKTAETDDLISLRTDKPGKLSELHWARKASEPLTGDLVEVEPYATGLNFRDVLCAMRLVDTTGEDFGGEAAGIVTKLGPDVKNLQVGDRVMLIGRAFSTKTNVSEKVCAKMPNNLSFDDAATMAVVYSTSIYSLFNVGGLKKGQSVLIHSACGGVGIASIQLAKMVGAEIYTTVGNDEKVQYLMNTFGLPRNRIFNSRNTSFVEDVMRETGNEGVDLALNSLSGELLHATWRCVANFGKLVEIGKRDLIGSGKLDMQPFLGNRSYCCVDLLQISQEKPSLCKEILVETIDYFKAGHILPIRPIKTFPANNIIDGFRYMQQGVHIGKIVISMRDPKTGVSYINSADVQKRPQQVTFDGSSAYLLVGGLGGLGRSVSTWMTENGARHLIYLSRSASTNSEKHKDFVSELESMGCKVDLVQGSVAIAKDVEKAVKAANGKLKGILNMSMVLCDQAFNLMSIEEWNTATQPKVEGTWNLHDASVSAKADLDFFVLFSSISGTIGQPGQANYASANTFLDAFVQHRTSLGLNASAVNIGAVQEVGYVAQNESLMRRLKSSGTDGFVSEQDLLDSMAAAMTYASNAKTVSNNGRSTFIASRNFALGLQSKMSLKNPDNRAIWKKDIRMAQFHNDISKAPEASGLSNDILKTFLAKHRYDAETLKAPETVKLLATEVGKKLCSFLLKPENELDTSASMVNLGMDSLVAIEIRVWWKQIFDFDVSMLEMLSMGTIDALGQHAADTLLALIPKEDEEAKGT